MLLLSSAEFFFQQSFRITIRVSNGLDPDQNQHCVGPDLCLFAMLGNFSCFCCHLLTFSSKNSFRNIIRVSNGLDPDQDRCSVGPDLVPNCLQRLSLLLSSADFFFKKFFQKHYQSVKQFGSRSGHTFCRS